STTPAPCCPSSTSASPPVARMRRRWTWRPSADPSWSPLRVSWRARRGSGRPRSPPARLRCFPISAPSRRPRGASPLLLPPASPATDVAAPKADGGPDSGQSSSLGVLLVVDDDQGNRDLLARRLVRDGYTVHTAADGHAALETLGRTLSPPIELVLLD